MNILLDPNERTEKLTIEIYLENLNLNTDLIIGYSQISDEIRINDNNQLYIDTFSCL